VVAIAVVVVVVVNVVNVVMVVFVVVVFIGSSIASFRFNLCIAGNGEKISSREVLSCLPASVTVHVAPTPIPDASHLRVLRGLRKAGTNELLA